MDFIIIATKKKECASAKKKQPTTHITRTHAQGFVEFQQILLLLLLHESLIERHFLSFYFRFCKNINDNEVKH